MTIRPFYLVTLLGLAVACDETAPGTTNDGSNTGTMGDDEDVAMGGGSEDDGSTGDGGDSNTGGGGAGGGDIDEGDGEDVDDGDGDIDEGEDGGTDDGEDGGIDEGEITGPTSIVRGRIAEEVHFTSGSTYRSTSFQSTTSVRFLVRSSDGSWQQMGSSAVESDGSFEAEAPAGHDGVIVEGLDLSGNVVAMGILETTGEEGDENTVRSLDLETWVESMLYLEASESEHGGQSSSGYHFINVISLMTWVDANLAEQVFDDYEDDGDGSSTMSSLCASLMVALHTETQAWSERGYSYTQQTLFNLQLSSSQSYSESMHEGEDSTSAMLDLLADLQTSYSSNGSDEEDWQSVHSMTSLAFRLMVSSLFEGSRHEGDMMDAVYSSCGRIEGFFSISLTELLQEEYGDGGSSSLTSSITASLWTSLRSSYSDESTGSAYDEYESDLLEGDDSLLGELLDFALLESTLSFVFDLTVESSFEEAAQFDSWMQGQTESMTSGWDSGWDHDDASSMSEFMVQSWLDLQSEIRSESEDAEGFSSSRSELMTELLISTLTTFRARD